MTGIARRQPVRSGPALRRFVALVVGGATLVSLVGHMLVNVPIALAEPLPTDNPERLYLRPDCLPPGDATVTVYGRNFVPNERLTLHEYYTPDFEDPVVTTDAYGSFSIAITVIHEGYSYIDTTYVSDSLSSSAYVYIYDCGPTIVAKPQCQLGAAFISISGFHWSTSEGTNYDIELHDSSGIYTKDAFSASTASWTSSLTLSEPLPNDEYEIWVRLRDESGVEVETARTYFLVPCPDLSIGIDCVGPGAPPGTFLLTVTTGSVGRPLIHSEVFVEFVFYRGTGSPFDPGASPQEFEADEPDAVSYSITPYARPPGTYTLLMKQGYNDGGDGGTNRTWISRTVALRVPCVTPPPPTPTGTLVPPVTAPPLRTSLTVEPLCGPPQLEGDLPVTTFVIASGTGFVQGAVVITVDPGGANQQQFSTTAAGNGTFSQQISIRAGPDGKFLLRAQQTIVGAVIPPAEAVFSVPCITPAPVLTADILCGPAAAGVPAAYAINLAGAGFLPGRVDLTFDATGLLPEAQLPATAAADGTFSALITPAGRGPGKYVIRAHQQVTGSLTVVDAAADFFVPCDAPAFAIVPNHARRGFVVTVSGANFPGDSDLYLRWDKGINAGTPYLAHTDANGVFTRQVLLFAFDFTGPRKLSIELAADPLLLAGGGLMPADFTVVDGTVTPPFRLTDDPDGQMTVFRR